MQYMPTIYSFMQTICELFTKYLNTSIKNTQKYLIIKTAYDSKRDQYILIVNVLCHCVQYTDKAHQAHL